LSAQYFIAKTVQDNEYVVLLGANVISGPHPTAAAAVKARDELLKAAAGDISAERVAET
jgi:hypothetical protein